MAYALVTIKTEGFGTDWVNTWGVNNAVRPQPFDEGDLGNLLSFDGELVDLNNPLLTTPTDQDFGNIATVLVSLIAFHRIVTADNCRITGVYVSDGKDNDQQTVFYSAALNLNGFLATLDSETTPLSICWLIKRQPNIFSMKPGRLYLRAALTDGEVQAGMRDGVTWASPAASQLAQTRLNSAVTASGLDLYFGAAGATDRWEVGIPRYSPAGAADEGQLTSVQPIQALVSGDPVSRQLNRGKRRKATGTTP